MKPHAFLFKLIFSIWIFVLPVIVSAQDWEINVPEFLDRSNIDPNKVFQAKNPEGEFLTYYITDKSSVSVVGGENGLKPRTSKYGAKTLTIPPSVRYNGKEYTVRYIQSFAFYSTNIDEKNLKEIEEIILPNTLEMVGQNCFSNMPSLKSVTIPKSLKVIGYCMFEECPKLEEVFIPYDSKLKAIGEFAFKDCPSLKYFHIPANVRHIGGGPWRNCISLSEINVASTNKHFVSENGVLLNKDKTKIIQYPPGKSDETYVFPAQVTFVGNSAFFGNNRIKSVVMSETTRKVSHIAFKDCKELSTVYFPNDLAFIGNGAFWDCPKLKKATIPIQTQISKQQSADDSYNSFMPKVFIDRSAKILPYVTLQTPGASNLNTIVHWTINNMTTSPLDITASTNKRYDLNNQACALIIVQMPSEGCYFQGSVIGEAQFRVNEYWVYMSSGSKYLKIQMPNRPSLMVDFNKYGFTDGVESLKTYYLSFSAQ